MNKRQQMNLDIVSRIDDEIIEKNTIKRARLLAGKGRRNNKKLVLLLVAIITLIAIMIPLFIVLFSKQVPVYEGMTVSTTYQPSKNTASSGGVTMLSASGSGGSQISFLKDDNGNHNGHNKKPVDDIVDDEFSSSLTVPEQQMYYANPSQDIYITVHISNPDSFEILSFTLNGKKYSSYMFEDGSDMENLILKVTVPAGAEGITEYTIDAIKYVDGTAIKDVKMEGDRTVKVGVYTAGKQPTASVSDEIIGINDISFTVSINDRLDLIKMSEGNIFVIICDDSSVVYKQELNPDEINNIKFDRLIMDTTYRYAIVANYDSLDGSGFSTHILYEKEFTTKNIVAFKPANITQSGISFTLEWEESFENKVLDSLALYRGEEKVRELDVNATSVDGLLSNNEYRLVGTYTNKGETETSDLIFTTQAKATPEITITENNKTQTSLKFDISVTDIDSVGAITKIELIHGEDVKNITDLNTRELADLLSNNKYTVKVTYTYDLNDGIGNQTVEKAVDITTEEKAEPVFTFKNMSSETYSLGGEYDIMNVDSTLISYKVELYRGNELVKENADKKIAFDSLDYYTDYTVKITYTFDVNDGKGVQTKTAEYTIKTLPYIDITECKIANTSAVSEGDTIFMQVKLDNPLDMTIESVVVNGETYSVTGASTTNRIFVEIVYSDQFAGGDTYLKVDKVNAKIDTTTLAVAPKTELSDNVFINGKLEVLSFTFVNEHLEPIDWTLPSQKSYLLITFSNPTGYEIDSVTIEGYGDGSKLIKVDNNTYYCETTGLYDSTGSIYDDLYGYIATATATQVTYSNNYLSKTTSFSLPTASLYLLASDEIHYIITPTDLLDMDDDYYYELKNDIDLSGIEWIGNDFNGVFDGKGYSIKNMSFVGTERSNASCLGLFAHGTGVIKNLTMEKVTIIADVIPNSNNDVVTSCGSIVAYAQGVYLENCSTDEDCLISVTVVNRVSYDGGPASVGGLIGCINDSSILSCKIEGCVNNASVSVQDNYAVAGGILGNSTCPVIITGCTNYGTISSDTADGIESGGNGSGGILGACANINISKCVNYGSVSSNGTASGIAQGGGNISKCINYGTISSGVHAGGIGSGGNISDCINYGSVSGVSYVGGIALSGGNIKNCLNIGKIIDRDATINGIIGGDVYYSKISGCITISTDDNYSWLEFDNCYGTDPIEKICTVNQLNSKEFYTETLGWSEDIWDFSELDYENGKYPKLK